MREERSSLRAPFPQNFPQIWSPRAFSAVFVPFPHFFLSKINLYFRQESAHVQKVQKYLLWVTWFTWILRDFIKKRTMGLTFESVKMHTGHYFL